MRNMQFDFVTRESARLAIEHMQEHNGPGRELQAQAMLQSVDPNKQVKTQSDATQLRPDAYLTRTTKGHLQCFSLTKMKHPCTAKLTSHRSRLYFAAVSVKQPRILVGSAQRCCVLDAVAATSRGFSMNRCLKGTKMLGQSVFTMERMQACHICH